MGSVQAGTRPAEPLSRPMRSVGRRAPAGPRGARRLLGYTRTRTRRRAHTSPAWGVARVSSAGRNPLPCLVVAYARTLWTAGFWSFAWVDSDLSEDRHQGIEESLELLMGFPDLADLEVPVCSEADVILAAIWSRHANPADRFVVLRCSQRHGDQRTTILMTASRDKGQRSYSVSPLGPGHCSGASPTPAV